MEEEYKPIEGYENYEVSNFGHVRNKKTGKFLNGTPDKDGYKRGFLTKPKTEKHNLLYVHRIVGLAFLDNQENRPQIDHIDNNVINNNITNLRWANHSENNRNTKLQKINKSGIKGVCWCNTSKKWRAHIHFNGENVSLGKFSTIEEATQVRLHKVNEIFGDFFCKSYRKTKSLICLYSNFKYIS